MDQSRLDLVSSAVHVGTASVNWGFDPLYTWVRTPPLGRVLDEMAAAGYEGTEISYHFPADAETVRAELTARGLRAAGSFCALDLRDRDNHAAAVEQALGLARRLGAIGADTVILSDAPTPQRLALAGRVAQDGSDDLDAAAWGAMVEGLSRVASALREREMLAVFHPHVGTFVESRREIDRLCRDVEEQVLALCPDTGHLAYAGVDLVDLFSDYASRIRYVHLKDVDGPTLRRVQRERIGFADAVGLGLFVPLGSGIVPMDDILGALRQAGYAGWLIVEQDAPREPFHTAVRNRRFLRDRYEL